MTLSHINEDAYSAKYFVKYRVSQKKTQLSGILAITPLWKGLELKVAGVSKTSENFLCDRHKNSPI